MSGPSRQLGSLASSAGPGSHDGPPASDIHPGEAAAHRGPLRSLLAYAEREAARRAKGTHPGMTRLQDDELGALLELLRREVGAGSIEATSEARGTDQAEEPSR